MKTNNFIILMSLVLGLMCSCSENKIKTDRETNGLKGNVKSVFTINYKAIDKFGEGVYVKATPNYFGSTYIVYDTIGNILSHKTYMIESCKKDNEYYYDKNNRLVKYIFFKENDDTKMRFGKEYSYNEKGEKTIVRDLEDNTIKYFNYKYNDKEQLVYFKDEYGSVYTYDYDDNGKVINEKEKSFYGSTYNRTYSYDSNGNMLSETRRINSYDGEKDVRCFYFKYDENNRAIDIFSTNNENQDEAKVIWREKSYYQNASSTSPFHTIRWGENGEIESEEYFVWFIGTNDTLSVATLNKDYEISNIKSFSTKGSGTISTNYAVESSVSIDNTYNYIDKKLISISNNDGHNFTFEYEDDEIKKCTHILSSGKEITLYEDNLPINITTYDKHNKVVSSTEHGYEGDSGNGTTITKILLQKDQQLTIIENHIVNGRTTKSVYIENGITTTTEYTYNEQGDVVLEKSSNGHTKRYDYKYDAYNNWTQQICFVDDKVECINERAVNYY